MTGREERKRNITEQPQMLRMSAIKPNSIRDQSVDGFTFFFVICASGGNFLGRPDGGYKVEGDSFLSTPG